MQGRGWQSGPILQFILGNGQTGVNPCVFFWHKPWETSGVRWTSESSFGRAGSDHITWPLCSKAWRLSCMMFGLVFHLFGWFFVAGVGCNQYQNRPQQTFVHPLPCVCLLCFFRSNVFGLSFVCLYFCQYLTELNMHLKWEGKPAQWG